MNQWIPVSERLPDSYRMVLIAVRYPEYDTLKIEPGMIIVGQQWRHANNATVIGEVVFWQPLPEPPQEEV